MIGRLVAHLKKIGLYDKALIVVTADNGESFLHKNHDRHIADAVTFTDIASTPLFIKRPFQKKGGYDDRLVRTWDIVPTIASEVGIRMPWKVKGRSIFQTKITGPIEVHREQGKQGTVFRASLSAYIAARRQALDRKIALFGSNGDGPGLFGIGPNHELVGKSTSEMSGARSRLRGRLTAEVAGLLKKVDTKASFLPANITGTVTGAEARRGVPLALALNGKVVATGWTAMLRGDKRVYFSFFAPPDAFKDGANQVQIFDATGRVL
jgi:hypothetical protein